MFYRTTIFHALTLLFVLSLSGSCIKNGEEKSLFIYCAAGMKAALEPIAKSYEKEYGVNLHVQYGGSGTLLSNLRVAKTGDLYLAADKSYLDEAVKYDLVAETQPIAYIKPVIAVAKGNPKNIRTLDDLLRKDVDLVLANPNAASIGRQTKQILNEYEVGLYDRIESKLVAQMTTVNEVANTVKLGTSDAGIVWDAVINQYEELESITIPVFDDEIREISLGVLKVSEQPQEALKFLRYMSSKDRGLKVFYEKGYQPITGDKWEENPNLLFYCGALNRLAIDNSLNEFENREGVIIDRDYNECGILDSQIKAGKRPDAYLTCDQSIMAEVGDKFISIVDVSKTNIVIAVKRGNPKNIKDLKDLAMKDIKIGICSFDQNGLGAKSKVLLDEVGIWDIVRESINTESPTAELLVEQMMLGTLDAVIVYKASVFNVKDQLDVISIKNSEALAIQNFGISIDSDHKNLLSRLLKMVTSEESKSNFINHGFEWKFKS